MHATVYAVIYIENNACVHSRRSDGINENLILTSNRKHLMVAYSDIQKRIEFSLTFQDSIEK